MRCKCGLYIIEEPTERGGIIHAAEFCGGTHAYHMEKKEARIRELLEQIQEYKARIKELEEELGERKNAH